MATKKQRTKASLSRKSTYFFKDEKDKYDTLPWRVNVSAMFKEAINNPGMSIMKVPFQATMGLLAKVGVRASEINDDELNGLMTQLSIYEIGDPYSGGGDNKLALEVIDKGRKARLNRKPLLWVIVYKGPYEKSSDGQPHYVTPRTFNSKKEAVESLGAGRSRSICDRFIAIVPIQLP